MPSALRDLDMSQCHVYYLRMGYRRVGRVRLSKGYIKEKDN